MIRFVSVCLSTVVALGCAEKKDAAPTPTGQAAAAKPTAAAAGAESKGPLVKAKVSKDECTFEFAAPEELKQTTSDGVSVTYESASFSFTGFAGADLKSESTFLPYIKSIGGDEPIDSGRVDGVQWAITVSKTPAKPIYAVYGSGGEVYGRRESSKSLGCAFSCTGTKEHQADVIAMCKSVKISVDESKIPK